MSLFADLRRGIQETKDFPYFWRFSQADPQLAERDLREIHPLDQEQSARLRKLIFEKGGYSVESFSANSFQQLDDLNFAEIPEEAVGKWLAQKNIPPEQEVFLSYNAQVGLITTWDVFARYWDTFYYPSSDDLTIVDQSGKWVMLFSHEEKVFFGSNP